MSQVEVYLYSRRAGKSPYATLTIKDSTVVRPDDLNVGPALFRAKSDSLGDLPWIPFDVNAIEPETSERLKDESATDIAVGGPELAAEALRHGLVDEIHLVLSPVAVGGGRSALPQNLHLNLDLIETRSFDSGAVYLAYRVNQ